MNKYIAEYLRLSQDDETLGESNSITNQRRIIRDYIAALPELSGLYVADFVDDGYSGTNFDRPGVKRLLDAVRRGEICCIIVKDFSRLGRQYLEVSRLIEQIFPYIGVRFIAVNDHYDSNNHKEATADIDVPVRNMINAMYSKDISKKVKSAKRSQLQRGVFSNAFAPYGYKKDESDRHILLIDEPAAEIVKRIFDLAANGGSAFQIADRLNADGVAPPSVYKKSNGSKLAVSNNARALWTNTIISRILNDERYTGTLLGGRHETSGVGSGKKRRKPKEAWIRIPDALPVIITQDVFNELAAKRRQFASPPKPNTDRLLYKKVRCGHCNHILQYIGDSPNPYYLCHTARYTERYGCVREGRREQRIVDAVRMAAEAWATVMHKNKKTVRRVESIKTVAARLDDEIKQLQTYKRQLYENYISGALEKDAFMSRRASIEAQIETKAAERDALITEPSDAGCSEQRPAVSKHPPMLPDEAINEMVDSVYVYDTNRIEVRFSFRDPTCYAPSTFKLP